MYTHLFQLYIENNMEIEAYRALHNIKNKALINEFRLKLSTHKSA
jgi:hypothetical protein